MPIKDATPLVLRVAAQAVDGLGLAVDGVSIKPAGASRLVQVVVDRDLSTLAPGDETSVVDPVSLDDLAVATRGISRGLDETQALGDAPYTLEVSSPGVDRPLTQPRHFRRNVGRLVRVVTVDGGELAGRVEAAGEAAVVVSVASAKGARPAPRRVGYAEIARAHVQVEFGRQSDPLGDQED